MVTGHDPIVPLQNRETDPDPAQTKGTTNFIKTGSHLIKENNIIASRYNTLLLYNSY